MHLRLTRELAEGLAERAETLGVSRNEVIRRVCRQGLAGKVRPAGYVAGSTCGVPPMVLARETVELVHRLVSPSKHPAYDLRRWLQAGLMSGAVSRAGSATFRPVGMRLDAEERGREREALEETDREERKGRVAKRVGMALATGVWAAAAGVGVWGLALWW